MFRRAEYVELARKAFATTDSSEQAALFEKMAELEPGDDDDLIDQEAREARQEAARVATTS